ncbi:head-tail connector protein [Stenotrophomonas bentonitica]|uniref:head-tail connector protein n=1 Tax=Stenotrophomonas bentonitica TaxID=1450134 RepID=UPI003BACC4B0
MGVVTREDAKAAIPVIHDGDDDLIDRLIVEAEAEATDYLKRPIPWLDSDGAAVAVPGAVAAAVMLKVVTRYKDPEAANSANSDKAFERLLWPHRRLRLY